VTHYHHCYLQHDCHNVLESMVESIACTNIQELFKDQETTMLSKQKFIKELHVENNSTLQHTKRLQVL